MLVDSTAWCCYLMPCIAMFLPTCRHIYTVTAAKTAVTSNTSKTASQPSPAMEVTCRNQGKGQGCQTLVGRHSCRLAVHCTCTQQERSNRPGRAIGPEGAFQHEKARSSRFSTTPMRSTGNAAYITNQTKLRHSPRALCLQPAA
jgi:hypothetical protein